MSPDEEWAVEVIDVSKEYRLGEHIALGKTVAKLLSHLRPETPDRFSAVHHLSLRVERGEILGLIGPNGSGKSTFMRLLAGITVPSHGELRIRGSVLPLLAIGSGFHHELTGRENVQLAGAVLGLRASDVRSRLADIAEFAGIERHFDTPIKRYSDGMQARLSFAIAVLFPADVYLFDEVLAVVDGEFETRCLTEIRALADAGRTVVIVTHDLDLLPGLCHRVLWLESGHIKRLGDPSDVIAEYSPGHTEPTAT
jgi:ABC-type polysaccharide/polyol phosphate transport system ATPase subunit